MTCRKGPLTIKTACQNRQIKKIRITDHTRKIGLASGCLRSPKETCQSIGPGLAFKIMISIAYSSTMIKLQTQARSAASITQGICVDPEKHLIKYLASSQKKTALSCNKRSHSSQFLHTQFNSHPLPLQFQIPYKRASTSSPLNFANLPSSFLPSSSTTGIKARET